MGKRVSRAGQDQPRGRIDRGLKPRRPDDDEDYAVPDDGPAVAPPLRAGGARGHGEAAGEDARPSRQRRGRGGVLSFLEGAGHGMLPQGLLRAYKALCDTMEGLRAEKEALRAEILALLEQGATIEPGELVAEAKERSEMRLSWDKLIGAVGESQAAHIRSRIAPTRSKALHVRRRAEGTDEAKPGKARPAMGRAAGKSPIVPMIAGVNLDFIRD